MSVNFFLMKNVDIFISIKDNIDAPDVTCNVLQGDTLIFKHPSKMYISLQAASDDAAFSINSWYSPELKNPPDFTNRQACSDFGAHIGDIDYALEEPTVIPDIGDDSGIISGTPAVEVLNKLQREALIRINLQAGAVAEVYVAPVEDESDDVTFKVLLMVVGSLLIIVAGLLFANTWVQVKHTRASLADQNQIRQLRESHRARQQQRQQQQQQQQEGSEESSESSEEQSAQVQNQMSRIAAINQALAQQNNVGND